jgi:type IV fimbrial biogenesis protein FimT
MTAYHCGPEANNPSCYKEVMKSRQKGLTLVELMVTLAAAIILLAVGMPMFSGIVGSNKATTRANNMLAGLKLARNEAVKRGGPSYLCAAATTLPVASPDCATSSPDWTKGWIVHADDDLSNGLDPAVTVRTWSGIEDTATVTFSSVPSGLVQVEFDARGTAVGGSYSFDMDDSSATASGSGVARRCLSVLASGQVRMARGACP